MSQPTVAATGISKPMTLPPALVRRLRAYARARGLREEDVIRRALDRLLVEREHASLSDDDLVAVAASPDWEVEVPVVVAARPKTAFRVDAQVVRCRRGTFSATPDEALSDPEDDT